MNLCRLSVPTIYNYLLLTHGQFCIGCDSLNQIRMVFQCGQAMHLQVTTTPSHTFKQAVTDSSALQDSILSYQY